MKTQEERRKQKREANRAMSARNKAKGLRADGRARVERRKPRGIDPEKLGKARVTILAAPDKPGQVQRSHWPLLREVCEYRLESASRFRRQATIRGQTSAMRAALRELPERPSDDDFHRWMIALAEPAPRGPGLRVATINTYKQTLNAAYEWCRKRGKLHNAANPLAGLPDLEDDAEEEPVKPGALGGPGAAVEVYERLRAVFDDEERVALSLLRYVGLSKQEIFGLRVSDFDQRAWTLQIVRAKEPSLSDGVRKLKTRARTRMVVLSDLMPDSELRELAALLRSPRIRRNATLDTLDRPDPGVVVEELFPWASSRLVKWMRKFHAVAPEVFGTGRDGRGRQANHRPLHIWRHAFSETAEDVLVGAEGKATLELLRRLLGHSGLYSLQKYLTKRRGTRLRPGEAVALKEALRTGRLGPLARPMLAAVDTEKTKK